jgi:hypothetical protein
VAVVNVYEKTRDLVTVTYDGHRITSPWVGQRFTSPEQNEHADHHRERVRQYLTARGLRRLS